MFDVMSTTVAADDVSEGANSLFKILNVIGKKIVLGEEVFKNCLLLFISRDLTRRLSAKNMIAGKTDDDDNDDETDCCKSTMVCELLINRMDFASFC